MNVSTPKSPKAAMATPSPPETLRALSSKLRVSIPLAPVSRAVVVGAGVAFTPAFGVDGVF